MKKRLKLFLPALIVMICGVVLVACAASTISVPSAPQDFAAVSGSGKVTLSWDAPEDDGGLAVIKYQVLCSNEERWINSDTMTGHVVTGLTNGTLYTFKVRAVNSMGKGEAATVTATPGGVELLDQQILTINSVIGKKVGDADFSLSTTGGSGTGTVTYTLASGTAATVSSAGLVHIVSAGNISVTATKAADANYNAVTSAPLTITINKGEQAELEITDPGAKTILDPAFQLYTTGGTTGGAVTFELVTGSAADVDGDGFVTILDAGSITVRATMAGNANYEPVVSANLVITITFVKSDQATLTIDPVAAKTYGDASFQLTTSGGSGIGAVTYELVSGPASVTAGGMVTISGAGEIVVRATKAADDDYNQAVSANLPITVNKAAPATPVLSAVTYDPLQTLNDISLPSGWTWVTPTTVPDVNTGTYLADFAGDSNYNSAFNVSIALTVNQAAAVVPTLGAVTYDPSQTLNDISLPSGWTWVNTSIIPDPTVSSYLADFAGDSNYNSALNVNVPLIVNKAQQAAFAITDPGLVTTDDVPFQLLVSGGTTAGAVTFDKVSGDDLVATVSSSGYVTIFGAGVITVNATMAGDVNYESVVSTNLVITVEFAQGIGLAYTLINGDTEYSVSMGTASAAEIIIPSVYNGLPVTEIDDNGFKNYTGLTNIIIPPSVLSVGDSAFENCTSLTTVIISNSVTFIGTDAFKDCTLTLYIEQGSTLVIASEPRVAVVWECGLSLDKTYVISIEKDGTWIPAQSLNDPYRESYTFGGWSATDGGTIAVADIDLEPEGIYYAIWTAV